MVGECDRKQELKKVSIHAMSHVDLLILKMMLGRVEYLFQTYMHSILRINAILSLYIFFLTQENKFLNLTQHR
jgi:hypothetical protein